MNEAFVNNDVIQAFWDNPTDEEELRNLMISSFTDIIKYFNKMDYTRWINKRNLPDMIRRYVIRYYDREAEASKPGALGLYSDETKDVRIRKHSDKYKNRLFDMKHVTRHETLHFIAHAGSTFHAFIDEGLTELLNKIILANKALEDKETRKNLQNSNFDSYSESVSFAKFLCSIFGKDMIKNFISGVSPEFYERFYSSITPDGKEDMMKTGVFNTVLDNAFSCLYAPILDNQPLTEGERRKNREKFEDTIPLIMNFLQNIIINRVREEANDLAFIKNEGGSLSLDEERVRKCVEAAQGFLGSDSPLYKHYLSKLKPEDLAKRRKDLTKALAEVITSKAIPLSDASLSKEETKRQLFANFTDDISKKEENKALNVSRAIMRICKVANIIYPGENKESELIKQFLEENLPSRITKNADFMGFLTSPTTLQFFKLLSAKNDEAKRKSITTSYIRIRKDLYLEQRDDQASLFAITSKEIMNVPLVEGKNGTFSILDFEGKTYTIENLHKGLGTLRIFEGNKDITPKFKRQFRGEEEFGSEIISEFFLSQTYSKVAENAYVHLGNNSGNQDRRTRLIDFESIIRDVGNFNDVVSEDFSIKTLKALFEQIVQDNFYFTPQAMPEGTNATFEKRKNIAVMVDSMRQLLNFPHEPDSFSLDILQTANESLDDLRWMQVKYEQWKKKKEERKVTLQNVKKNVERIKTQVKYIPKHGEKK